MKNRKLVLASILVLLGAAAAPALLLAEVQLEVTFEYYPVEYVKGLSVSEMMVRSSPLGETAAGRAVGDAWWRIRYPKVTFTRPSIDVCRVDDPGLTCTCRVRLPKLVGGDEKTRARFEERAAKTKKHELEHCNIALTHARRLEEAFLKLGKTDCKKIRPALRAEFDRIYSDCRRDQAEFDHRSYGYKHYLRMERDQALLEAGFNFKPPRKEGYRMPVVDREKRSITTVTPDEDKLSADGIYKDENGIWRNY